MTTPRLDTALRLTGWISAGLILLAPAIAMRFTPQVNWTVDDFIAAGLMLGVTGLAMEAVLRASPRWGYRIAGAIAAASGLMLVWASLAVGLVGAESEPVNLLYAAVIAVLVSGAFVARLKAGAMARTLIAAAATQGSVTALALVADHAAGPGTLIEILGANSVFIFAFLLSAGLFAHDARRVT
ncbi:MAG: hypothetical protein RIA71_14660 [Oceanicaulis sp.]